MTERPCSNALDADLRSLAAEFRSFEKLMTERDLRYGERDVAAKDAVKAALQAVKESSEQTAVALSEYKSGANEWRGTVQDLLSSKKGGADEMAKLVRAGMIVLGVIQVLVAVGLAVYFRRA